VEEVRSLDGSDVPSFPATRHTAFCRVEPSSREVEIRLHVHCALP